MGAKQKRPGGIHLALVAVLGLVVLAAGPMVDAANAQEAIFLVRHAERLNDTADSPLSEAGRLRAQHLARMLRDAGITSIFVTQYQRTAQTAKPLADLLRLTPVVTRSDETAALVKELHGLGPHARALVVSHSDRLPVLLEALGYDQVVVIPPDQYDDVLVVTAGTSGKKVVVIDMKY